MITVKLSHAECMLIHSMCESWLDDSEKRLAEGKNIHPSNDVVKSIHNKMIALV
ncbi:MAG TPA: hypothetical protein VEL70_09650 [Candidatus Acidoferrum sp.]|nr:hypothetical protein [Candidatus Acidoferrum sp.]